MIGLIVSQKSQCIVNNRGLPTVVCDGKCSIIQIADKIGKELKTTTDVRTAGEASKLKLLGYSTNRYVVFQCPSTRDDFVDKMRDANLRGEFTPGSLRIERR